MKKIIKNFGFIILIAFAVNCSAASVNLIVNNQTHIQSAAPVYVYPDFDEGVYATILQGGTCNPSSDYQTCLVNSGSLASFIANKYDDSKTTIICLSKRAPSGSFDDCAPGDCEVQINFTASGSIATPLNGNCSGYTFPGQTSGNGDNNNTINVK